jgi:hypothetical protein
MMYDDIKDWLRQTDLLCEAAEEGLARSGCWKKNYEDRILVLEKMFKDFADTKKRERLSLSGDSLPVGSLLQTNGLYAFKEGQGTHYLRFYADGTVLSVLSEATPYQVANWELPLSDYSVGRIALGGTTVRFSIKTRDGTVDYVGTIAKDVLELDTYSHIPGDEGKKNTRGYAFLYLNPGNPAGSRTVPHKFSYGSEGENKDITILEFQYGNYRTRKDILPVQHLDTFLDIPQPRYLYVKWRINSTKATYDDYVDLQAAIIGDMTGQIMHFALEGQFMSVYVISHQLHDRATPDCPLGSYKDYLCTTYTRHKAREVLQGMPVQTGQKNTETQIQMHSPLSVFRLRHGEDGETIR